MQATPKARLVQRDRLHGSIQPRNSPVVTQQTACSSTADDSGGSGGIFGLAFSNPGAITETSFVVRVNKVETAICSSNDSPIVTDAEFRGNFFNTENSPTTQVGNVVALIDVGRDQSSVGSSMTVAGSYARCDDQFCASQTLLDYRVLGSVRFGYDARLRIKWDQQGHRFIFQLNNDPEVVSNYTVSDSSPAVAPSKAIDLARVVPHCSTAPRPFASIDASFRAVYVNP